MPKASSSLSLAKNWPIRSTNSHTPTASGEDKMIPNRIKKAIVGSLGLPFFIRLVARGIIKGSKRPFFFR